MKSFAIILASGSGSRYGDNFQPKHLLKVNNIPIISWTLNSVILSKIFHKVVIVTKEEYLNSTMSAINMHYDINKNNIFKAIGGAERMDSFFNGLKTINENYELNDSDTLALIDANRPFFSPNQLVDLNRLALKIGCSCPARPVVNGVARINKDKIVEIPKKESFMEFVTPEIIKYKVLKNSLNMSDMMKKSLIEYALIVNVKPGYIISSELNSKLTYPEDLAYLEGLVKKYDIKLSNVEGS